MMFGSNVKVRTYFDREEKRVIYAVYVDGHRVGTYYKRSPARLAAAKLVPPIYRPNNPRIHIFGPDGTELGVTYNYRNILHAMAHEPEGCTFEIEERSGEHQ